MGSLELETTSSVSSDGNSSSGSLNESSFKFSSTQAAILLAQSALHRSLQLTFQNNSFQDQCLNCIGVGCTSSLVGKLSADGEVVNGRRGRKSRAYIALCGLSEGLVVYEVRLDSGESHGGDNKSSDIQQQRRRRSRSEEEAVVSNLVLLIMMRCRELQSCKPLRLASEVLESKDGSNEEDVYFNNLLRQILDRTEDVITEHRIESLTTATNGEAITEEDGEEGRQPASAALGARQIINGDANVVAILPVPTTRYYTDNDEKEDDAPTQQTRMETITSDGNIPFPNDVLIVPGSFNPPHVGHVGLANAAVAALKRLRQKESKGMNDRNNNYNSSKHYSSRYSSLTSSISATSSATSSVLKNMWDAVEDYSQNGNNDPTVLFEMSVTNADKPPLDPAEVERRVNMFASLEKGVEMPSDWAVILTNAPLFSQKTSILDNLIPSSYHYDSSLGSSKSTTNHPINSNDDTSSSNTNNNNNNDAKPYQRKMSFVLGTDTMVRIINPKYYGDSRTNMLQALVDMKERGVHFIVGGRLEQGVGNTSKFVNGEEEVKSLPLEVQEMFTLLTEDEFRLDISSAELRKQLLEQQKL